MLSDQRPPGTTSLQAPAPSLFSRIQPMLSLIDCIIEYTTSTMTASSIVLPVMCFRFASTGTSAAPDFTRPLLPKLSGCLSSMPSSKPSSQPSSGPTFSYQRWLDGVAMFDFWSAKLTKAFVSHNNQSLWLLHIHASIQNTTTCSSDGVLPTSPTMHLPKSIPTSMTTPLHHSTTATLLPPGTSLCIITSLPLSTPATLHNDCHWVLLQVWLFICLRVFLQVRQLR